MSNGSVTLPTELGINGVKPSEGGKIHGLPDPVRLISAPSAPSPAMTLKLDPSDRTAHPKPARPRPLHRPRRPPQPRPRPARCRRRLALPEPRRHPPATRRKHCSQGTWRKLLPRRSQSDSGRPPSRPPHTAHVLIFPAHVNGDIFQPNKSEVPTSRRQDRAAP
jgi:hypothetical protein